MVLFFRFFLQREKTTQVFLDSVFAVSPTGTRHTKSRGPAQIVPKCLLLRVLFNVLPCLARPARAQLRANKEHSCLIFIYLARPSVPVSSRREAHLVRTSIEPPLFRKLSRMIVDVPAGSRVKTVVPKRLCLFCYAGYYARVTDPARPPPLLN